MRLLTQNQVNDMLIRHAVATQTLDNSKETIEAFKWCIEYLIEAQILEFVDGMYLFDALHEKLSHNQPLAEAVAGIVAINFNCGIFILSQFVTQIEDNLNKISIATQIENHLNKTSEKKPKKSKEIETQE